MDKKLYLHKKNYVYDIVDYYPFIVNEEKKYLLFNQARHYWIVINDIGLEIYKLIGKLNYLKKVRKEIINKYNISEEVYQTDVIPIIYELEKDGFILEEGEEKKDWIDLNLTNFETDYLLNYIYINISDKCNLDCIYCFNKEKRKDRISNSTENKLTVEIITGILREYKNMGGIGVVFTGGEPTLCCNLMEFCKEAKSIGLETHIITNGTLLYKLDNEQLCNYVDGISLSLDSVVNDELKTLWNIDVDNNVERILEALQNIDQFSINNPINITIMPIVTKINMKNQWMLYQKINETVHNCKVNWKITKYGRIHKGIDDELDIEEAEYVQSISENMKKAFDISENDQILTQKINYFAITHSGQRIPSKRPKLMRCIPSLFITYNGDVFPCQHCEVDIYKLGNIHDTSLNDIFQGPSFQSLITDLSVNCIEECKSCELRYICTNIIPYCMRNQHNDGKKCKTNTIQRMYLLTYKRESD